MIRKLCEKFTTLNESDIQLLYNVNEFLPLISQVTNGDVFIDCMTREPDTAIVVAEAKKKKSLYKKNVVGEFALRENEPAVLRTMDTGLTTRELKGISQENIPIEQSVTAIKNGDKVVGTLIVEKDATKDFAERRNIEILSETAQQLTQALMFHNRGEEHKIDYITNYVTDGIMIFDKEGVVIYANPMAISIYKKIGYKDDIIGMHFDNVALDEKTFKDVTETTYMEVPEIHIGKLNLNVQYSVLKNKDDDQRLVVLIRDMTELRNREKELILKSVAIREIHHRVKNNLWNRAFHLSTAGVWIDNARKNYGTRKRKGQLYIQTWHGQNSLKPVGKLRGESFSKIARIVTQADAKQIDCFLVDSQWSKNMFSQSFYGENFAVTGSPRSPSKRLLNSSI